MVTTRCVLVTSSSYSANSAYSGHITVSAHMFVLVMIAGGVLCAPAIAALANERADRTGAMMSVRLHVDGRSWLATSCTSGGTAGTTAGAWSAGTWMAVECWRKVRLQEVCAWREMITIIFPFWFRSLILRLCFDHDHAVKSDVNNGPTLMRLTKGLTTEDT
ncbi:hypothetical protein IW261DRAFT_1498520 [Armillaria novae-zelandiae]|uniref:Uncharacterized protein n=1 Tax=Armillaria novae-zelandiae TaxID=153914 RepID=A0AA39T9N9_9AGAR|nr:hypothetical protein IW261DRAFT_1498520 [Armillaria novae-zelandiae]